MITREYFVFKHQCTCCKTPCDPSTPWSFTVTFRSTETGNENDIFWPDTYRTEAEAQAAADAYEQKNLAL